MWYKCSFNNHLRHHGGPCVTTDTVPQTVLFPDLFDKPLFAQFNQEQASSDGGAILLKAAERIYGLVKAFAGCLFDKRAPDKTRHSLADLIGQRIFGIACGHPDCNDGDRLAADPIHKLLLDRDPVSGERLASQPTLSRFENAVNGCALYRLADELATGSSRGIAAAWTGGRGASRSIWTRRTTRRTGRSSTRSSTGTTTTGAPLLGFLTFDRESEQYLCAALLRHGKAVASDGTVGLLSRLLAAAGRFRGRAFSFGSTGALPARRSPSWRRSRGSRTGGRGASRSIWTRRTTRRTGRSSTRSSTGTTGATCRCLAS